jgi:predicted phage-related endonuclease
MIILKFNNEESWLEGRLGKVTGTRAKDLISKRSPKPKKGFWEIIAERVAIPANGENVMDRGHRLEEDAILRFQEETGKKVNTDLVIWSRDDNADIAISPDGYIDGKKITEACEVKCLNSASHIEAFINKEIPADYQSQKIQYFVVNDDLKVLYFVFFDPRMPVDFFYLTIKREDIQDEITEYLEIEKNALAEINRIEGLLTF